VEIWTDHSNLQYFMTERKLNQRQARWSLYLVRFDFTLLPRLGCSMGKLDALSRRADHGDGASDNKDLVLLRPELFAVHAVAGLEVAGFEREVLAEIHRSRRAGSQDEPTTQIAEGLQQLPNRAVHSMDWIEQDGVLLFRGKVYVSDLPDLCRRCYT